MRNKIDALKETFKKEIKEIEILKNLEELKVKALGKKSKLTELAKEMKNLSDDIRPEMGKAINEAKEFITNLFEERFSQLQTKLRKEKLESEVIDITLPGKTIEKGTFHPITETMDLIKEIFVDMGFDVADGPEIEKVEYNFDALNIPKSHPSRDTQDTFYIDDAVVLRTQTSPVQVRYMQEHKPPFRMISPGKVYRPDYDISHTPMFHQTEGLMIGENISFADLKGILTHFVKKVFGETEVRFRPHFFPFTEPSAEMDVQCSVCHGAGCRMCKGSGWVEIMGCGMVHPNVLTTVGYDPNKVSGFAFGMGMERIAMLRYGIDDLRAFFENDVRFLRQFK
ncbi:phenylalanine--tRNA ligase subunit alpha [Fusobacterium sp. PH5-44]|uniref:phenylalanine--tRNA ligase subunit alpha n=1 Tax=unclassified Fusobacterium TaxID=2648384 RepID=UPI003D2420DE